MGDPQLSFRKSANVERVTDKRKDSLFRLVDTDGSGTIDAQEFAVLYDAIKRDLAEELEKEAVLEKEASSARRRFKMLLLFVAVLISFLAASVAANFAVIFAVVDSAITTTTTSDGLLEVKGSDTIAKTAVAVEDVPLIVAPVLDLETLATVKSLKVSYGAGGKVSEAQFAVVAVRKHNTTFVEFVTDVPGETVEALNGVASYVLYRPERRTQKFTICSANATCSAFKASGIDVAASLALAKSELEQAGFGDNARRLQTDPYQDSTACTTGTWELEDCGWGTGGPAWCGTHNVNNMRFMYHTGYTSTRHVVFFLHGIAQDAIAMFDYYCMTVNNTWASWVGKCPALMLPQFEHLVFAWVTTGNWPFSWATDANDPLTYNYGAAGLQYVMCSDTLGWTTGTCAAPNPTATPPVTGGYLNVFEWGAGTNLGIGSSSSVMVVGYSDGGGFATYLSYVHGDWVTKAIAIDYHGYNAYQTWLTSTSITHGTNLALKITYSCSSFMAPYLHWGITTSHSSTTIHGQAGLTADNSGNPVSVTYGPAVPYTINNGYGFHTYSGIPFREWSWSSASGAYLKFAVHGLTADDIEASCSSTTSPCVPNYWSGTCDSGFVHTKMPHYINLVDEIEEWINPPPPSPPVVVSPAPSPPVITPAPVVVTPSGPSCAEKEWCCPARPEEFAPFHCVSHIKYRTPVCMGKKNVVVPAIPCKELPWFEVCEMYPRDPFEAMHMAAKMGLKLETLSCVTDEICKLASRSLDKAVDQARELGLDYMSIPCLGTKYMFTTAYAECNAKYICSLLNTDKRKAFDLAKKCFGKSPYELPGC